MFHTPETTCGDSAFGRVIGYVGLSDGLRVERHLGGRGEGAEEAREEVGHAAHHDCGEGCHEEKDEGAGVQDGRIRSR